MKKILLSIILLFGAMLTGCVQLVTMSDEESNMIAEYMAGTYLQQTDYAENLVYPNEEVTDSQDSNEDNTTAVIPAKTPATNADKSITNTEEKTLEVNVIDSGLENNTVSNSDQNTSSDKESNSNETNSASNETDTKELSINDVFNYKNFHIKYSNYKVLDSYQSKINGSYFNLEPTAGDRLLVANFIIKNISKRSQNFNLIGKDIQYILSDSSKEFLPMLTLLNEDLQYIDVTINPGKTYNAVIVYEVPKNIDKAKLSLSVLKNSKTANITMN